VAPLLDRDKNVIARSTCGFIQFVVAPLYDSYVNIMQRCAVVRLVAPRASRHGLERSFKVSHAVQEESRARLWLTRFKVSWLPA